MRSILCDSCGGEVKPRTAVKLALVVPVKADRPLSPQEEMQRILSGGDAPARELHEYELCTECGLAIQINFAQRRLALKRTGKVEET